MVSPLRVRLLELLAEVLQTEFPEATQDIRRRDCEAWDSVSHFRFILELEAVFGLTLEDDDVAGLGSLGDAEALVAKAAATQ